MTPIRTTTGRYVENLANRLNDPTSQGLGRWHDREERPHFRYEGIATLAGRYGYRDESLSAAEYKVFSQNGEDGVLAEIFSRIGSTNRYFVEFGVGDATICNTRFLAEVLGWSGVYFEPHDEKFARLSQRLANREDLATVHAFVSPQTVDDQFREVGVPSEPDLVSIDVDGQDYYIWQQLTAYRPRVLVIEYNSSLPASSRLVESADAPSIQRDFSDYFGCSIGALIALGKEKGYTFVHAELAGVNAFFVRDDCVEPLTRFQPLLRGMNFHLNGIRHPRFDGTPDYVEV